MSAQLSRLAEITPDYDVIFCDIWGVLHDGIKPYPTAVEALKQAKLAGKNIVLITNAPYSNQRMAEQLAAMGLDNAVYDAIMSSGEVTRKLMGPYAGKTIHHIGQKGDDHLFANLALSLGEVEQSECVIVTELESGRDTPKDYLTRMENWLAHKLPFICVNPDKQVEVGNRIYYCPGSIADIYAEMGGTVIQAGKPYAGIYQAALEVVQPLQAAPISPNRVLAIGDSLRTDAKGAADQGFDFLFITGSLHAEELDAFGAPDGKKIAEMVGQTGARLVGFQARLH